MMASPDRDMIGIRAALCAISIAVLSTSAACFAQGEDLAMAACEAVAREDLADSANYRRLAAEIDGSAVVISFEVADASGAPARQQIRCIFTYNASTAAWGFATGLPARNNQDKVQEARQVAVAGALAHRGIYPIPRDMT